VPAGASAQLVIVWNVTCTRAPVRQPARTTPSSKAAPVTPFVPPWDGKWLAYASDESGGWNIYATTFPNAEGKWQVSVGGGTEPRWRDDGKEMFYLDAKGMLTAASISAGSTFSSGTPQPLFRVRPRPPVSNTDLFSYDVSKDGSRFIVNRYIKPSSVPPLDILLNATAKSRD
jgi:eukaryotic-like serine/threonine-protein kinase